MNENGKADRHPVVLGAGILAVAGSFVVGAWSLLLAGEAASRDERGDAATALIAGARAFGLAERALVRR